MKQLYFIALFVLIQSTSLAHFGSKGPFGGSVTCAYATASTVYLGTAEGGVYETTSSALTNWRARPVGLKSGKITALTHNGDKLIAGTADSGVFIFNGSVGSDLYWTKINNGLDNKEILSLLAFDLNTLFAGTTEGLYISTDNGSNWTLSSNGNINVAEVTAIVKAGSRIILATRSGGLFYSDDTGTTWSGFNDSNTSSVANTIALSYNASTDELLVINDNGVLIAGSASSTTTPTFNAASSGLPGANIRSVANNGTNWYLATDAGVFTTNASSINWAAITTGLTSLNVKAVVPFSTSLVCGTESEGVFKASTTFTNWTPFNASFNNLKAYSMTSGGELLVVAATEKGVFVSKDLANIYVRANNGLIDSLNVQDIILADFCLLAATKNEGVFFSADTGKNWTAINTGLMNTNIKKLFYDDGIKYAVCSNGTVYSAPLHGSAWTAVQTGLPSGVEPTSMTFFGEKVLLGTYGHGVFVKSIYYNTWSSINTGLSNLNVTSVAYIDGKIFAGTDGSGVMVSDSNTASINWTSTSATSISHTIMIGLDGTKIQALATYKGYLFASYKGGLLATSNYGASWIAGGNQFNLPSYTDVNKISFVTTRVFVTTENNGLYSNGLSELPFLNMTASVSTLEAGSSSQFAAAISPTPASAPTLLWSSSNSAIATVDQNGNVTAVAAGTVSIKATAQDGSNLNTSVTLIVSDVTSTKDAEAGLVKVYPNPATDVLNFETTNETVLVSISDLTGRIYIQKKIAGQERLTISDLPAGMYLLSLNGTARLIAIE